MGYWDDSDDDRSIGRDVRRRAIFEGLTGRTNHSLDSTEPTHVIPMLMSLFGYEYRGKRRVNTAAAARLLGVSRRTVQRYIKQGTMPKKSESYKKLRRAVRQQVTLKRGRQAVAAETRKKASAALHKNGGVRLNVHGLQGPPPSSREDLRRIRNAFHEISGEQFEQMLETYVQGGDQAVHDWLQRTFAAEDGYLPDWTITSIDRFDIEEGNRNWF